MPFRITRSSQRVGRRLAFATLLLPTLFASCERQAHALGDVANEAPPAHVDSIFPIEEEIRRFRANLPDSVAILDGVTSRDELVRRFLLALETNDRRALERLAISRAEFAFLYYPFTRFTRRPYELSPALLWFQLENYGDKGLTRALEQYGGKPIVTAGHRCAEQPTVEDENRIWHDCVVRVVGAQGDTLHLSLFGDILERGGRFKFINFGNQL